MSEAITQAAAYDLIDRFLRNNLYDDDYAKYSEALEAISQPAPSPQPAVPVVSEDDLVSCLISSGCVGTVKMSFESGPMSITRPSLNATKFARAILALRPATMSSEFDVRNITKAAQQALAALAELADWHWSQAATLRKAAGASAMDKPEPCQSSLTRMADWHDAQKSIIRAALQDKAGEVPDGFALVPVEPTEAMIQAGIDEMPHFTDEPGPVWSAMLSAVPKPGIKGGA